MALSLVWDKVKFSGVYIVKYFKSAKLIYINFYKKYVHRKIYSKLFLTIFEKQELSASLNGRPLAFSKNFFSSDSLP